eukprot:TRINITY_DN517_c0_g1_i8.p1 TRINITY_DN517_c0_g1~~TRINITY_DN517_c0_g1_i8.p1  ORF type:complete len:379 (+),score=58.23 TRINITY_DN517_c0_g1_i8:458-1594(+)
MGDRSSKEEEDEKSEGTVAVHSRRISPPLWCAEGLEQIPTRPEGPTGAQGKGGREKKEEGAGCPGQRTTRTGTISTPTSIKTEPTPQEPTPQEAQGNERVVIDLTGDDGDKVSAPTSTPPSETAEPAPRTEELELACLTTHDGDEALAPHSAPAPAPPLASHHKKKRKGGACPDVYLGHDTKLVRTSTDRAPEPPLLVKWRSKSAKRGQLCDGQAEPAKKKDRLDLLRANRRSGKAAVHALAEEHRAGLEDKLSHTKLATAGIVEAEGEWTPEAMIRVCKHVLGEEPKTAKELGIHMKFVRFALILDFDKTWIMARYDSEGWKAKGDVDRQQQYTRHGDRRALKDHYSMATDWLFFSTLQWHNIRQRHPPKNTKTLRK